MIMMMACFCAISLSCVYGHPPAIATGQGHRSVPLVAQHNGDATHPHTDTHTHTHTHTHTRVTLVTTLAMLAMLHLSVGVHVFECLFMCVHLCMRACMCVRVYVPAAGQ